jgi:quinol monooxygenase YgiN
MSQEVVVIYKAHVSSARRQEILDAFLDIARPTHAEDGCLTWAMHQDLADPDVIVEVSRWASPEASELHGKTPYVQEILRKLNGPGVLQRPAELISLRALGFGTPEKAYLGGA